MANIRILSVEDDPIYAETIRMVVEQAGYELVGQFSNSQEALLAIKAIAPDLLLLDIHIDGPFDGIQLAEKAASIPTIFVTSLRDKEVFERAKNTRPCAFILKPFDSLMLQNTIELAISQHAGEQSPAWNERDLVVPDSFFVKEKNALIKLPMGNIHFIEAEDKFCTLHTAQRKYVVRISLHDILTKLPSNFVRVHRSIVVDAGKILKMDLTTNEIHLEKVTLPVGSTYKESLLSGLAKIG